MKKLIALLVILSGFMFTDLNAQACCTTKKECKPKQCCPTKPDCCKETKNIKAIEGSMTEDNTQVTEAVDSKEKLAVGEKTILVARKED